MRRGTSECASCGSPADGPCEACENDTDQLRAERDAAIAERDAMRDMLRDLLASSDRGLNELRAECRAAIARAERAEAAAERAERERDNLRECWDMTCEQIADMCKRMGATEEQIPDAWTLRDRILSWEAEVARLTRELTEARDEQSASAHDLLVAELDRLREEAARLRAVVQPFARAARAHGIRRVPEGDLWVSLGVAGSAWLAAMTAMDEVDT